MNKFLTDIKELRTDLSDWLIHFTSGTNEKAEETMIKILSEAKLRSSKANPFVCFSEAPLGELNKLFQLYSKYPTPRFAPFGVAVLKTWLFAQRGRPVIYGPKVERDDLPEHLKFRHVEFDPPHYDFSWQREWRVATDQLSLDPDSTLVILPNDDTAHRLTCPIEVDFEYESPGEVHQRCYQTRKWYSLSLDQISSKDSHTDLLISKAFQNQNLC